MIKTCENFHVFQSIADSVILKIEGRILNWKHISYNIYHQHDETSIHVDGTTNRHITLALGFCTATTVHEYAQLHSLLYGKL